jgi:hypothetical protein
MAQDNLESITKNPCKCFQHGHWCGVTKMADHIVLARLAGGYLYLSTPVAYHLSGGRERDITKMERLLKISRRKGLPNLTNAAYRK